MISEERLSKALTYLAETDEKTARAKAYFIGLEEQIKSVKAVLYLQLPHDLKVADKDAHVCATDIYRNHIEKYTNAVADYEILKNKRETESLLVEVWRSLNSARKKGLV